MQRLCIIDDLLTLVELVSTDPLMEYFLVLLQDKLLVLIGQPALHLASHRRQLIPLGLLVVLGVVDDILGRCAVISQHI